MASMLTAKLHFSGFADRRACRVGLSLGRLVHATEHSYLQLSFRGSLCEGQVSCIQRLEKNLKYGNFLICFDFIKVDVLTLIF